VKSRVGVTHPGRIGYHVVVHKGGGIDRVEARFVQVGLEDTFLEVVEHHVLRAATEVTDCALMQLSPDLVAGLPDYSSVADARVEQRGDEQAGSAIGATTGNQGGRPSR
jgi:hypothetical protein